VSADSGDETRENSPGARQALAFFLVAMCVGVPGLLLGGPIVGYFAFLLFGILFVVFFSGDKRRLCLVFYLLLAVGLLVGGLTYSRLNSKATAAQLSSLPLIGSLLKHTAIKMGVAILAGLTGGLLAIGLPLWLTVFISAEWMLALRETYDLDRKLATKLLLYLALGIDESYAIADEGEIKETKPQGPLAIFGAPAVVVVKPYNAVVLESGGRVTRIEGPGLVTLRKHEIVKAIVDLRTQGGTFDMQALTKDNVPLAFRGSVAFRIESWKKARDRGDKGDFETKGFTGVISGPYPVYRRTLHRAVYGVKAGKDWQSQTIGMAAGRVAAAIRGLRVDEIFVVDENERVTMERSTLLDITDRAKPKAIETGRRWGVKVNSLNVFSIEMPEEVQKEFLRRWGAPWRGWQALIEAEAKRRVAITGAEGEQEVTRFQADAKRWKIVTEALAKLEAKEHEIEAEKRVARSKREIAEAAGEATLIKAKAQSDSQRIRARASAEAEAAYLRHLAEALLETLGEEGIKELLVEIVRERFDLNQMRRLASIMDFPSQRILLGGRQNLPEWGPEERGQEEKPDVEE